MPSAGQPWNINIHYDALLESKVPLGLKRLAGLVSPGGTLAVVTFVKPALRNGLWHLTSWPACGAVNRMRREWEHTAPIKWPPPETLQQLRADVRALLPGARIRRLLYGRALISWRAPG